ncbi:predicted protein [Arabidopsis lyrata subsp. lyrata]|uniref:Predicted protein n=1 Tax=Arabidopsis lyrata subsp. lyrata TaxID=81972 RepID=D7KBW6_ARALL|nr:predicted protein [Arabidopsis lyrata subsp. lyrata]
MASGKLNHMAKDEEFQKTLFCIRRNFVLNQIPKPKKNKALKADREAEVSISPSKKPHKETSETKPSQLMLEQRKKYTEVTGWTAPEPPDATVIEAVASLPEPKPQKFEVAVALSLAAQEEEHEQTIADEAKANGNIAFSSGDFHAAVSHFTNTINLPPTKQEAEKTLELKPGWRKGCNSLGEKAEEKPEIQIPHRLGSLKGESNRIGTMLAAMDHKDDMRCEIQLDMGRRHEEAARVGYHRRLNRTPDWLSSGVLATFR